MISWRRRPTSHLILKFHAFTLYSRHDDRKTPFMRIRVELLGLLWCCGLARTEW